MDIYGAEKAIANLKTYVQDVYECRPGMYKKSKDRLRDIAGTCSEIVDLISVIVEDASLSSEVNGYDDYDEFLNSSHCNDNQDVDFMLMEIGHKLDYIQSFLNKDKTKIDKSDIKLADNEDKDKIDKDENNTQLNKRDIKCDDKGIGCGVPQSMSTFVSTSPANPPNKKSNLSSSQCKTIIHKYAKTINNASLSCNNIYAKKCCELINDWFENRFLEQNKDFRYNPKHIGKWIEAIIIGYGKALHDGEKAVKYYTDHIYKWVDSINEKNTTFVLPYDIYQLTKEVPKKYVVRDTLILWDMLLNAGYDDICDRGKDEIYISDYSISEKFKELTPSILENTFDYIEESDKLSQLWWGRKEEMDYVSYQS